MRLCSLALKTLYSGIFYHQLSQKCAVQTTSAGITLGNFDGECLSKIGWCKNGMTVSVWIKQHTIATGSDMVFFTSGGDESDSNGFAFVQKSSDQVRYTKQNYPPPQKIINKKVTSLNSHHNY